MRTLWRIGWIVLVSSWTTACLPSFGPFSLPARAGRVVDADSGAPIAHAEVFEWWHGAGTPGAGQPVYHARWTTADEGGRFAFEDESAPSLRMWLLKTYGPSYSFYAADYGLQPGPVPGEGDVVLRGATARADQARAELAALCRGDRSDAGAVRLRATACPPRSERD